MLQEVRDSKEGEWSWSREGGRSDAQRLEREARAGPSHLLPLQAVQVHLRFSKDATCENPSSEREMRRRGSCPSMTSAASPTSPLVGSPPPCGRPSGWVLLLMMMASTSQQGGLVPTDLFDIGGPDDAARNAKRFERIWEEEKQRCENTSQRPSLNRSNFTFCKNTRTCLHLQPTCILWHWSLPNHRAAWRFGRTRFLISLFLVSLSMFFQFFAPVSI